MRVINENEINHERWGTGDKIGSEQWMTAVAGKMLFEGMKVLDYGCGGGRLCNYISKHISDFKYYGLEPCYGDGPSHIEFAKEHYQDPRVTFDFIGSYTEIEALKEVDRVVMGSILAHLLWEDAWVILNKFRPVLDRGGKVIATVFIGPEYKTFGIPDRYGCKNFFSYVHYTEQQLKALSYREAGTFLAQGKHVHHVIEIDRLLPQPKML